MKKFIAHPYGARIRFYTEHAAYCAAYKRETGSEPDGEPAGETFRVDTCDFLVGVFDNNPATAVHEAAHLAASICRDANIDPKESSGEEAYAYLIEHIWASMHKHMTRPPKPAKADQHDPLPDLPGPAPSL